MILVSPLNFTVLRRAEKSLTASVAVTALSISGTFCVKYDNHNFIMFAAFRQGMLKRAQLVDVEEKTRGIQTGRLPPAQQLEYLEMIPFRQDLIPGGNPIVDDKIGFWAVGREVLMRPSQQGGQPVDRCAFGDIQDHLLHPGQDTQQA
jgi:hypothetical protein